MKSLVSLLTEVSADLQLLEVRWALIGGLAVGARVEPRFTRDVDLAVDVANDAEAEKLIHSLHAKGYQISAVLEQAKTGRLATVRLRPATDDRLVDLLFASCGIESQVVEFADNLELEDGVFAPVATVGHLIAMKILARNDESRPQDRLDLVSLLKGAQPADIKMAKLALNEITEAGFDRGRELGLEFKKFIEDSRLNVDE